MSAEICPYCDKPIWVEMADHDYADEFEQECDHCKKTFEVAVEAIPQYILTKPCEHKWVDATNEVVKNGEYCTKCGTVRA